MGSISVNRDSDNHSDILFHRMKDCKLEGLIINCSSSCSNRQIKSGEGGGGKTNPARKSPLLSSAPFLPFLPLARVRVRSHGCLRDIDAILHSNAGQEASASLVLKPGIGIHRGPSRSLPPSALLVLSLALEGPKRDATKIIKSASFRSVCASRIWPWAPSISFSLVLNVGNLSFDPFLLINIWLIHGSNNIINTP